MFYGMGGWGMGFGGPFMILTWVLLIAAIVALVKWLADQPSAGRHASDKTALEILGGRYARGEIDGQEYAQKKRDLEGSGSIVNRSGAIDS
jgi:putative membrane protein